MIDAFTNALAPAFWYLVPLVVVGFVLALFLKEVKLSGEAGMVARGEAIADPKGELVEGTQDAPVRDAVGPDGASIPAEDDPTGAPARQDAPVN